MTSDCSWAGAPALANDGEAAFVAHCGAGPGVRKSDGVTQTDILTPGDGRPYAVEDAVVSIDDLGNVAFSAYFVGKGSYGILYGSGGPLTVVVDTGEQSGWGGVSRPSINNSRRRRGLHATRHSDRRRSARDWDRDVDP